MMIRENLQGLVFVYKGIQRMDVYARYSLSAQVLLAEDIIVHRTSISVDFNLFLRGFQRQAVAAGVTMTAGAVTRIPHTVDWWFIPVTLSGEFEYEDRPPRKLTPSSDFLIALERE